MYEDFKIYGPYKRKDGRMHIVLKNNISTKTISYPKYLMEIKLNRYLNSNETVDHIDRDFTNNSYDNLRVIDRSLHIKEDVKRNKDIKVKCAFCGKEFIVKGSTINYRNRIDRYQSGYFCSKQCSGLYGKQVQETGIRLPRKERVKVNKYINKNGSIIELV